VEVDAVNDAAAADGATPVRALAWDLDGLPAAELEAAYTRLADFVERLRGLGIVVPPCWYWHRPLLPWFLAIQGWYEQLTDSGNPRTMAEWWASTWSITGLQKAWREVTARCETKAGEHFHLVEGKEVPLPTLDEVIRSHLAYARDHPRAGRSRRSGPE
jgi:hypothetical protein